MPSGHLNVQGRVNRKCSGHSRNCLYLRGYLSSHSTVIRLAIHSQFPSLVISPAASFTTQPVNIQPLPGVFRQFFLTSFLRSLSISLELSAQLEWKWRMRVTVSKVNELFPSALSARWLHLLESDNGTQAIDLPSLGGDTPGGHCSPRVPPCLTPRLCNSDKPSSFKVSSNPESTYLFEVDKCCFLPRRGGNAKGCGWLEILSQNIVKTSWNPWRRQHRRRREQPSEPSFRAAVILAPSNSS